MSKKAASKLLMAVRASTKTREESRPPTRGPTGSAAASCPPKICRLAATSSTSVVEMSKDVLGDVSRDGLTARGGEG